MTPRSTGRSRGLEATRELGERRPFDALLLVLRGLALLALAPLLALGALSGEDLPVALVGERLLTLELVRALRDLLPELGALRLRRGLLAPSLGLLLGVATCEVGRALLLLRVLADE